MESLPLLLDSLSERESELSQTLKNICSSLGLTVVINPENVVLNSPAAIDVEHDEEGNLVGIGVYDGKISFYFTTVTPDLVTVLLGSNLLAHNGVGDFESLRTWGIPVSDTQLVHDTMLFGHIQDSSLKAYGLKDMAKRELGIEYPSYDSLVGKHKKPCPQTERGCCNRKTLDKWPVEDVANYNALDCYVTYQIYLRQAKASPRGTSDTASTVDYFNQLEKPVAAVFAKMEARGICIDVPYLQQLKAELEDLLEPIEKEIKEILQIENINSDRQVVTALGRIGIRPYLKGKASRSKPALEYFKEEPVVKLLLHHSELATLLDTFVYKYLARNTDIVHPFFNQTGTRTGRLSCSNPNLLQIPRRTDNGKAVRKMFIPRPGFILGDADFGQIEPRVLAHLSKDRGLCEMFNAGIDFHTYTSEQRRITRDKAKVLNLSVGYRASHKSVSTQLGCSDSEAQAEIDGWWNLFPGLKYWEEKEIYKARKAGYCTTLMGRRIRVDSLDSNNPWRREGAERQVINNICQGSAAEIMKLAMLAVDRAGVALLVQVYDELLWESLLSRIDQDLEIVKEAMTGCVKLLVPLTVDLGFGANWAVAK